MFSMLMQNLHADGDVRTSILLQCCKTRSLKVVGSRYALDSQLVDQHI
jgi:hypothetical protein